MARKLKNVENQKLTQQDLEYGEKNWKKWKMRKAHCKSGICQETLKNEENEKDKLQDLDYGKKL